MQQLLADVLMAGIRLGSELALFEKGGSVEPGVMGIATVIADPEGGMKHYIRKGKERGNFLIPVSVGDLVFHYREPNTYVQRITAISPEGKVTLHPVAWRRDGKDWQGQYLRQYDAAVSALYEKAECYQCRHAHYALPPLEVKP